MILRRQVFYVIRHGQTTDNAAGMISGGGRDPHLTEEGKAQALRAAARYTTISPPPPRIVTSALIRTHQTAQMVTGHNNFTIDERLNERYLGPLDGTITEAEQKRLGTLPEEETTEEQAVRVITALNEHLSSGATAFFVIHGGTIRRILEAAGLKGTVEAQNAVIYRLSPAAEGWAIDTV